MFHKIIVPVGGIDADEEAIKLACRVAKKDKAKIHAVYVIAIKRTLPLDAKIDSEISKGEEILDHIETMAEDEECTIETDLLQAREVGPAIVDDAIEQKADLILMGVKYKSRFGEFSLGNAVLYVLKNAPCRVILYHQPTSTPGSIK